MKSDANLTVSILPAVEIAGHVGQLGAMLHACVHVGASIG